MTNEWKYMRHEIVNSVRRMIAKEGRPLTYAGITDRLMPMFGRHTPSVWQLAQWIRLDARDLQIIFVKQVAHVCPTDELNRFLRGGKVVLINKQA